MALPTSRDITLASKTVIPSTLLNNIQDMIVGRKHGLQTLVIPTPAAMAERGATGSGSALDTEFGIGDARWRLAAGDATTLAYPIMLPVGTRIIAYSVHGEVLTDGDDFDVGLRRQPGTSTSGVVVDGPTTSPTTVALHKVEVTLGAPHVMLADNGYTVTCRIVGSNSGDIRARCATVDYDRP